MKIGKKIIEYFFVTCIFTIICFFVNKGIVIKGLYMDDLYHWSYFPNCSFFDFLKYDLNSTRYRPVFDAIQYFIYILVGNHPTRFVIINCAMNIIVALFIYHIVSSLESGKIVSLIVSSLYLISHFAYYQIGQAIGSLETEALLFSLIILYLSLRLTGVIVKRDDLSYIEWNTKKENIICIAISFIMFFLITFTHERYMWTALLIVISIIFAKCDERIKKVINYKTISLVLFLIEIIIVLLMRTSVTGKILPAGTGGTYVEETFSIKTCFIYCIQQVAMIFGMNIGPDYLFGIDFLSISNNIIKYLAFLSTSCIFLIFTFYVICRLNIDYKNQKVRRRNFIIADVLFLIYIALCIASTSVSVRVEMRFIYASFTCSIIFLSYMYSVIKENEKLPMLKYISIFIMIIIFVTRLPIELEYRKSFNKIHCYVDQLRMNSLYDNTVGVYGLSQTLHDKKIYIVENTYGMTNFYAEYFYKIHDKDGIGNKIIFINNLSELPDDANSDNSIVLIEDYSNIGYARIDLDGLLKSKKENYE